MSSPQPLQAPLEPAIPLPSDSTRKWSVISFIALGSGLLVPIAGLILVAIAFVRINKFNQRGLAIAIIAMFVSATNWGLGSAIVTQSWGL